MIFLARTGIEYFHMGIFVSLWVYLIKKYGCQTKAFFSVFQCFLDYRDTALTSTRCTRSGLKALQTTMQKDVNIYFLQLKWFREKQKFQKQPDVFFCYSLYAWKSTKGCFFCYSLCFRLPVQCAKYKAHALKLTYWSLRLT